MAVCGKTIGLLDYGAGNVRSVRNAIRRLGYNVQDINTAEEILAAEVIVFPGVGAFGQAMKSIDAKGWRTALMNYLNAGRPFLGICIGMQSLFEGSDESPEEQGLGIVPGRVTRFADEPGLRIPQIGWNTVQCTLGGGGRDAAPMLERLLPADPVYYVHSFCAKPTAANADWVLGVTDFGSQRYIAMVQRGNVVAAQFHPEKSGPVGLGILQSFLARYKTCAPSDLALPSSVESVVAAPRTHMVKRIVACLDVRENDAGDLVVTKGDQYDVREAAVGEKGAVRNLGKPVQLCTRYYTEGADEVVFLNITSFRKEVLGDQPMLQVLEQSSENVFVPLTVGGGIRGYEDEAGVSYSALDVAARYFRAGADKVSIGGDAVLAAEELLANDGVPTGKSAIELISWHYGAQAVVVSVDPKRVYCADASGTGTDLPAGAMVVELPHAHQGPHGEAYCWWQCTVKGGRETRPIDAVTLAVCAEKLGAGELMVNCIDMDGQKKGYDHPLLAALQARCTIPIIASSGAGAVEHFSSVFKDVDVPAALAAGIFHRNEVAIGDVKAHLVKEGIPSRGMPATG